MLSVALALALQGGPSPDEIRAAVRKALPLLARSAEEYRSHRSCFSCHNQSLPVYALTAARRRGFEVDARVVDAQIKHTLDSLAQGREGYLKGKGQGGRAATASTGLWTLDLGGWKPDETTAAVAEYLIVVEKDKVAWGAQSRRPPTEGSLFTSTALAIRSLDAYATEAQRERAKERIAKAREWIEKTSPEDTEDRVFRLRGLKYAGAPAADAAKDLLATQREDGGWSQLASMESDAYATASALAALHEAGGIPAADAAYRKGLAWLLRAQKEDGSWHVRTRSKPVQTYFESGYPHGKDQFISISAASWAAAALAFASDP
jgi:hypothetical protein